MLAVVAICTPPRYILYPVTAVLSVAVFQINVIVVFVIELVESPLTWLGGVVSVVGVLAMLNVIVWSFVFAFPAASMHRT